MSIAYTPPSPKKKTEDPTAWIECLDTQPVCPLTCVTKAEVMLLSPAIAHIDLFLKTKRADSGIGAKPVMLSPSPAPIKNLFNTSKLDSFAMSEKLTVS